ncbi:OmcA/MtrC family decaheme c-type cytochrome [Pleionea sediminis]|uniref:OmcA/MtrC family decaheme c-type cytochrome n=1 Tax=Pleionea sediminis TaxID=2569479 RepID=UPI001185AD25|nr:OmcA/MtrC family decaheme c-type cytochrome [Pleionea sediminis]
MRACLSLHLSNLCKCSHSEILRHFDPLFIPVVLLLMLLISGCGDDGRNGAVGPEGPPGDVIYVNNEADSITLQIDNVETNGNFTVWFSANDQDGDPFTGLTANEVRFIIAKLIPGTAGDADSWQSYINRIEEPGEVGSGTEPQLQATAERNGEFTNNQNGTYRYTFATPIQNVSDPVPIAYQPDLVHRVAIQVSGKFSPINATYNFIPSTGATDNLNQRHIVTTETCNSCHGELAFHGGGRTDVDYCVTCHNPGSTDAQSGNTVDFKVMIHKIHRGADLPSVQSGTEYQIWGFRNSEHNYSDVHFPQNIKNCTKCHDSSNEETPQASNWFERPTLEACGSCHDDIDFADGVAGGHVGGVVTDNSECTTCHAPDRVAGSVFDSHAQPDKVEAEKYQYNILSITQTAPGEFPIIQFSITDPTNGDNPYSLTEPAWTASAGASRLAILLSWNTEDYANNDAGRAPATAVSMNGLNATNNLDGTFSITSSVAIPADMTGSGAAAIEGHPAGDLDGDGTYSDRIPVKGAVSYFAITDDSPTPRREVVDLQKCQNCHGTLDGLSFHGNNRTDNLQLCAMCHNPNNTDLAMRPTDPDGSDNEMNTNALDNLEEQTIDFKYLIHAIHGAEVRDNNLVVYGFGNQAHDFSEIRYPNNPDNCLACHIQESLTLPLNNNVLATTIDSQATVNNQSPFGSTDLVPLVAALDQSDDHNIGATAAVCSSCHDSDLAKAHMKHNGSSFNALQGEFDSGVYVETCAICHGQDRVADILKVHELQESP